MKHTEMQTKALACLAAGLLLLLLTGCSGWRGAETPAPVDGYPVDPVFRDFYESLGGEPVLGPAISPAFETGGSQYQYTVAVLMQFNPQALESDRFHLSPLGLEMGLQDLPAPPPEEQDALYLNGHVVFQDFVELYNRLGGLSYAGKPLTEVRHNLEKRRFEQYFENVGFYRLVDAPAGQVGLLAYGAWKCGLNCRSAPQSNSIVTLPSLSAAPFLQNVSRLGTDFTGFALTVPYLSQDGRVEQVFENLVMVVDLDRPGMVSYRPLPLHLGILPETMEAPTTKPGFTFFEIEPGWGYYVPDRFLEYIASHGGMEVTGIPIGRLTDLGNGISRQCFTNLCLEERGDRPERQRIQPAPLGYSYREVVYAQAAGETAEPKQVRIELWESLPLLEQRSAQELGVTVSANGDPLPNLTPILTFELPGEVSRVITLPATDQDGRARLILEDLPAGDGTLIPYQICVTTRVQQAYCVRDSFVVWNTRAGNRQFLPLVHDRPMPDDGRFLLLPLLLQHSPGS